jgi:hypothetical protein
LRLKLMIFINGGVGYCVVNKADIPEYRDHVRGAANKLPFA